METFSSVISMVAIIIVSELILMWIQAAHAATEKAAREEAARRAKAAREAAREARQARAAAVTLAPDLPAEKRRPGRPRKHPAPDPAAPKRKPGRPRKTAAAAPITTTTAGPAPAAPAEALEAAPAPALAHCSLEEFVNLYC